MGRALLWVAVGAGLAGYLVPPVRVLRQWVDARPHLSVPPPLRVPAETNGAGGWIRVEPDGSARWEGGDALPESVGLALVLFAGVSADALATALQKSGVDLGRSGYARDGCSSDGVVVTLGARGESEPELPQVWMARDPIRPCRVVVPPGAAVRIGPPGPTGWPEVLEVSDGTTIRILGLPEPDPGTPPAPSFPQDWRRAFDPPPR